MKWRRKNVSDIFQVWRSFSASDAIEIEKAASKVHTHYLSLSLSHTVTHVCVKACVCVCFTDVCIHTLEQTCLLKFIETLFTFNVNRENLLARKEEALRLDKIYFVMKKVKYGREPVSLIEKMLSLFFKLKRGYFKVN